MDFVLKNHRGGRNGADSPMEVPDGQCCEAINVDWRAPLGRKRDGTRLISTSGGTDFIGGVWAQYRHVPLGHEVEAEWWAVDSTGTFKRNILGVWTNVTIDDALQSYPQEVAFCTLNGKLFIAYDSDQDRLHVYDPVVNAIRRVGLAKPGTSSAANTGGGAYPAVLRYYRTRLIQYSGGVVIRRSEPSPSFSFTPSGAGTHARITLGTLPGERETHWEVEASADDLVWVVIAGVPNGGAGDDPAAPIAVATTTYDDNYLVADYGDLTISEPIGYFTLFGSTRFLSTDGNRLITSGSWQTLQTSRIWMSAVLGSADHGDDERLIYTDDIKGWVDANEKDGGRIMGMAPGAIEGVIYFWKYGQTWRLIPTGDDDAPYIPRKVTNTVGLIHHKSIVMAEDAQGNPIAAFLSRTGPYRVGPGGVSYMGRDIEDQWDGKVVNGITLKYGVNLDAVTIPAHGIFYAAVKEIWWYIATAAYDSPNIKIMQDVRQAVVNDPRYGIRGGWAIHQGKSCKAVSSVMFSQDIGLEMGRALIPYVGYLEP